MLNRRVAEPGWKAPCRHMKADLQPFLPCAPRVCLLGEESPGCVEKPHTGFQLLPAAVASIFAGRNVVSPGPPCGQPAGQTMCAFADQCADRQVALPVQSSQCPGAKSAQPAVQRGAVRMPVAHQLHCFMQALRSGHDIGGAGRLDYRQGVTLVWGYLDRQDAEPSSAESAPAFGHRCIAVLNLSLSRPPRTALYQPRRVRQTAGLSAGRTSNLMTDIFAFDCGGLQGIICDGDGNGDNTASASPRGAGAAYIRASLLPEKPEAYPREPLHANELFAVNNCRESESFLSSLPG